MKTRTHLLALVLVAFAVGLAFLQEPGFGDDFTYWSFAFDLHERGIIAWQKASFHDLRWPVWGVSWLIQAALGPGLIAYYAVPLLYLAGGAVLAFVFGRKATQSTGIAWVCGIAFLFHPLLDTICFRPMPDLSEGVWGAAAMLGWWALMQAERSTAQRWLLAALTGAAVFLAESNRVTGALIVPVLIACTLLHFRPRFPWLLAAGAVAALLYLGECGFYKWLFNDWMHNLHANMGNTENKGTEPIALWSLPFRFLDSLWKGGPLAPAYCILAVLGIRAAWREHGVLGRVLVLWFAILFMEYSCALQPVWPPRPLLRDADRFLAGLAVPFAILSAIGLAVAITMLARVVPTAWVRRKPALTGALALISLALLSSRQFTDPGSVPEMRRYMAGLPDGTKIFTHKAMREYAHLIDGRSAQRFTWSAPNEILHRTDALEAQAAECDEFWYVRKLVWLTTRKKLEKKKLPQQAALGSYFEAPEREWRLTAVMKKGNTPDLVFYQRRAAGDKAPLIWNFEGGELEAAVAESIPLTWTPATGRAHSITVEIPNEMDGKLARFELIAASNEVEAVTITVTFHDIRIMPSLSAFFTGPKRHEFLLKPYLYPQGGKEFFALRIPRYTEQGKVEVKFSSKAKAVNFTGFRAVVEP